MEPESGLLEANRTSLLVIDVQERFRPAMERFEEMLAGCIRLVRVFRALERPVLVTEQYPKGLGATVAELREALEPGKIPSKTAFSALGCQEVESRLSALDGDAVVVCGIEAHVCVLQSVLDLLASPRAFRVHVPVDAIESRKARERDVALARMERAGAVPTTTETTAFELLRDAGHPSFKEIQALFK